ncbi:MAG: GLUG motif-containing protein, partial [Candidatus Omnitrophota bacterium]
GTGADSDYIGGLVGTLEPYNGSPVFTISNSYATGNVSGDDYVAGLVGYLYRRSGTINITGSYYQTGTITGDQYVGGISGRATYATNITNSYCAAANITGTYMVGGLIGFTDANTVISNSFYNIDAVQIRGATGFVTIGGIYGSLYTDWINNGKSLTIGNYLTLNNGYYEISSITDFKNMMGFTWNTSYKFKLTANLDFTGLNGLHIPYFRSQEFDGNNKTISNLTISSIYAYSFAKGLFGFLLADGTNILIKDLGVTSVSLTSTRYSGGLIGFNFLYGKGLTLENCYVTGSISSSDYIGGLIGYDYQPTGNSYLTINNCYSTATVNGSSGNYAGGFIGFIFNAYSVTAILNIKDSYASGAVSGRSYTGGFIGQLYTHYNSISYIKNCFASGNVTVIGAYSYIGGFIGQNYTRYNTTTYSSIDNCYTSGNVTAASGTYVGGFIGDNYTPEGTAQSYVNNCYATGAVTGSNYVGGFIGRNIRTAGTLTVTKSYSTGLVTGSTNKGGFIGAVSGTVTITDCFYDSTASGQSDTGKGTPKTTAEMKQQATFTNWDFTNGLWTITETVTYPSLVWQGMVYNASGFIGGTDTDYPMLINTPLEIKFMETYCGSYYFRMNGNVSAASLTLNNNNYLATDGYDLTLTGTLSIASGSTLNATDGLDASLITLGGNWSNAGTFTCGTSVVTFNGSGTQTLAAGSSHFYDILFSGAGTLQPITNDLYIDHNLTLNSGAGTFDNATNNKNITVLGNVTMDNTRVDLGSGTWTAGGDFDYQHVTTWNEGAANIVMNKAGAATLSPKASTNITSLTINNGTTVNVILSGNLTVYSTGTTINGILNIGSGATIYSRGVTMGNDSVLTGNGTLRAIAAGGAPVGFVRGTNTTVSISSLWYYYGGGETLTFAQGTYDVGSMYFANDASGACILSLNGTYIFTGAVTFRNTSTGSLTIDNSSHNPNIEIMGSVDIYVPSGTITWTKGTGTITLADNPANGTQTINFLGKTVEDIIVNASGDTKQLTDHVITDSITITAGTLNANGKNITVSGSWTDNGGTFAHGNGTVTFNSSAAGNTITSGGSAFYAIVFANALGGWTIQDPTTTYNFTLANGSVIQNGNLTVTNDYSQAASTSFVCSAPETYSFTVGHSFSLPKTGTTFNRYGAQVGGYYIVRDIYDLQAVSCNMAANYKLANNIDATETASWNSGAGFNPIAGDGFGPPTYNFTGIFDGNGYVIDGLYIYRPSYAFVGLFGSIDGTVQNIGVTNADVTGGIYVGILSGCNYTFFQASAINNSYVTGAVSGNSIVGGLIGINVGSATVNNSYAATTVNGNTDLGGLIGSSSGGTITSSYYDSTISGMSDTGKGDPKTTAEMKQRSTFSGWDFMNLWTMDEGVSYPQFQQQYYVWDGGGSTNNMSEAANWNKDAVPGITDKVFFNNTNTKNATIDGSFTAQINEMQIGSGYTGTVTQSNGLIVNGDYYQSGTAFTGGTTLTVNGNFTLAGGTFTAPASLYISGSFACTSGTFANNSGTVTFNGTGTKTIRSNNQQFYNVIFNGTGSTWTLQDHFTQNAVGTRTFTAGILDLNGYNYTATKYQTTTLGNGFVLHLRSGITNLGFYQLVVPTGATVTISTGTLYTGELIVSGTGTFTCTGAATIYNDYGITITSPNWDPGTSTIYFYADNINANITQPLYNFALGMASSNYSPNFTLLSDLTVRNDFTIYAGTGGTKTFNAGNHTISVGGNWTNGGTFNAGTSSVAFNSSSTGRSITSGTSHFYGVTFNNAGGGWTLQDALTCTNITLTNGNLIDNAKIVTVNGNISISNTAGLLTSTGTWIQGANGNVSNPHVNNLFKVFQVSSGFTSTTTGNVWAKKLVLQANSVMDSSIFGTYLYFPTVNDFVDIDGTANFIGTLVVDSAAGRTQKAIYAPNMSLSVTAGSGGIGTVTMTGDWTVANLLIWGNVNEADDTPGCTLDTNGYNIVSGGYVKAGLSSGALKYKGKILFKNGTHTIGGDLSASSTTASWAYFDMGSSNISIGGNIDLTRCTVTPGNSTVIFTAADSNNTITSAGQSFNNMQFNNASGTWTILDTLTAAGNFTVTNSSTSGNGVDLNGKIVNVSGNFVINGGKVTAGASTITVGGNFTRTAGTFTYGTSTLDLTGSTPTYNCTNGVYNVRFTTPGQTVTLASTIYVYGTLTIGSVSGNKVSTSGGAIYLYNTVSPLVFNREHDVGYNITTSTTGYYQSGNTPVTSGTYGNLNIVPSGAWTMTMQGPVTANIITLGAVYSLGTLDTGGYSLTCTGLTLGGPPIIFSKFVANGSVITVNGNVSVYGSYVGNNIDAGSSTWYVSGNWSFYSSGTFTAGNSTVNFTASTTGKTITSTSPFYNVIFDSSNGSGAWTLSSDLTATNLTLVDGNLSDGGMTVTVNGNISIANTPNILTSTGSWIQGTNGNISNPDGTNLFASLTLAGPGKVSTLTDAIWTRIFICTGGTLQGDNSLNVYYFGNNAIQISGSPTLNGD